MKLTAKILSSLLVVDCISLVLILLFVFFYRGESLAFETFIFFVGVLVFINVFMYLLLRRRVVMPIMELSRLGEELDLLRNRHLSKKEIDEIDQLSQLFHQLHKQYQDQTEKQQQAETKAHELQRKIEEIEPQTAAFDDTKRAMLNIMEDLQEEKAKVEIEKVRDEAIITSIGEGLIAIDRDGKIIFLNPVAGEMLGLSNEKVIGSSIYDVFKIEEESGAKIKKEHHPGYITLKNQQKVAANTYRFNHRDHNIAIGLTATPVVVNNEVIGSIIVFRDITKEREVDRMKTEFISLASHQLRTPLSAIKWFGEMLLNGDAGKLTPEQKDMMANISQSTERMIALVSSLLNISRIESGRIIIDPKPTDIGELVKGVVFDVEAKLKQKKHKLTVDIEKKLPKINIDPRLVRHVYMNLLTNSIKYSPDKSNITIKVYIKGKDVISEVADNGYGIPEKQQHKMFEKFFRAENIIKVETDGTGLGMYLVKAIVESSGGKIWFKSKENKGTTFWFSLPLAGSVARKGEVTIDT